MTEFERKLWMKVYIAFRTGGSSENFSKHEAISAVEHYRWCEEHLSI